MKKEYSAPIVSVTKYEIHDIITASGDSPVYQTSSGRTVGEYEGTDSVLVDFWD